MSPHSDIERADAALRNARIVGQLGYNWFNDAIERLSTGNTCAGLDATVVRRLLDAAAANTDQDIPGRRRTT